MLHQPLASWVSDKVPHQPAALSLREEYPHKQRASEGQGGCAFIQAVLTGHWATPSATTKSAGPREGALHQQNSCLQDLTSSCHAATCVFHTCFTLTFHFIWTAAGPLWSRLTWPLPLRAWAEQTPEQRKFRDTAPKKQSHNFMQGHTEKGGK